MSDSGPIAWSTREGPLRRRGRGPPAAHSREWNAKPDKVRKAMSTGPQNPQQPQPAPSATAGPTAAPAAPPPSATSAPPAQPADPLSAEMREAIRSFMLAIVTPAGVALAVVSFLLGFFVNDVARRQAYETAFTQMSKRLDDISDKASKRVDEIADRASKAHETLAATSEKTKAARES